MHSRVEFYMNRIARYAFVLRGLYERVEQAETVDFGFEFIVEQRFKRAHFRVHNHYIARDSVLAQCHALVGHGHGQIVNPMFLQSFGNLYCAGAISVGFYHANQFCFGAKKRAIEIQICHYGGEINFQNRFVNLAHK